MSVTVFFNFQASQGNAEELLSVLRQGRDFGRTVEGRDVYDIYQGIDDPHRFVMVERWTSVEAHSADFEKVKASGMLDKAVALMVEPPAPPAYYVLR